MEKVALARSLAEQSAVLLKNEDGLLPLPPGKRIAVFGWAQGTPVLSGSGSGAAKFGESEYISPLENAGLRPVKALADFYAGEIAERKRSAPPDFDFSQLGNMATSGLMYEVFGKYRPNPTEIAVPDALMQAAARETDTALWILGRQAGGEECDRHLKNDFFLSEEEKRLLEALCAYFPNIVAVLNVNGLMELSWTAQIKGLLFLGIPGEQGPEALANLLTGRANPCGKLSVTIAARPEDYPAWRDFSWNKENPEDILTYESYGLEVPKSERSFRCRPVTVYREDMYPGYRYFDSFGVAPLYPFGFGLSYTHFSMRGAEIEKGEGCLRLSVQVKNVGKFPGAEVAQLYLSPRGTQSPQPAKALKAFAKTPVLQPGEESLLTMTVPWQELAAYREEAAQWVIEKGQYGLLLGNSSAAARPVGYVAVPEDILVLQTKSRLPMNPDYREKLSLLTAAPKRAEEASPSLILTAEDILPRQMQKSPTVDCSRFSEEELAALCVGYGPGIPFSAFLEAPLPDTLLDAAGNPITENDHPTGAKGYVSPAIGSKNVHSVFYKDGPAGIGGIAWPGEMLLACSFDTALLQAFGEAIAQECRAQQVDIWLAPALNLHRHPMCGRNFEYFSEDPYLTGACAVSVLKGVHGGGILGCAKHFAANEQETYRRGCAKDEDGAFDAVDTIVSERALREIYLKPFQMAVEQGDLRCIMTAFNKINGVFAAGSHDLCTHILRSEWGFPGFVVTDWGDMDIVVDGADAIAAGNDIIMPGGPPVIAQIQQGMRDGRLGRADLERAVGRLLAVKRA